jgi:hypothetical protein
MLQRSYMDCRSVPTALSEGMDASLASPLHTHVREY